MIVGFFLTRQLPESVAARAQVQSSKILPGSYPSSTIFPLRGKVKNLVRFWEKIFSHYPGTAIVIHDVHHPGRLIDVIDFELYAKKHRLEKIPGQKYRDKIARSYLKRYRLGIRRFRLEGKKALRHGAIEGRLFEVYRQSADTRARLLRGRALIRSQQGLADEFLVAARRARKYLPFMEAAFKKEKVPSEITRLAFVESMFNLRARSKVGASGIWQFMPATGRRYLKINHLVDERNSPYKSTIAAARLLKHNYRRLRTWPLAITAYNHGAAGMGRAVRRTGTRHLDKIIGRYRSQSFGFASRNFYAEFVAAFRVYDQLKNSGFINADNKPGDMLAVRLTRPLTAGELLKKTRLSRGRLMELNPCIRPAAFLKYAKSRLPASFELYLPGRLVPDLKVALNLKGGPGHVVK